MWPLLFGLLSLGGGGDAATCGASRCWTPRTVIHMIGRSWMIWWWDVVDVGRLLLLVVVFLLFLSLTLFWLPDLGGDGDPCWQKSRRTMILVDIHQSHTGQPMLPEQRFDAPFHVYHEEDVIRTPIGDDGIGP